MAAGRLLRRASVAIPCSVLALAACGGSSKAPWEQSAPCLKPLGTLYDHGRPLSLPFRNPFSSSPSSQMASPRAFERELEVSYRGVTVGANAVAFFFFKEDADAKRILKRIHSTPSFFPTSTLETIGPAIVRWSSNPGAAQRAKVAGCIHT